MEERQWERLIGVGCTVAVLIASTARAEERGALTAPSECRDRENWLGAVRARLPPLLQTHPLLDTFSLRIEKTASGGYTGEVSDAGAALTGSRSVRGETCEDVIDASSFIVALGLEQMASQGRDASLTKEAEPASVRPGAPIGTDASGAARVPRPAGVELGATAFALVDGGLTPGQSVDLGLSLRLTWAELGWHPLLLVGAYSALPDERALGGGRLRFTHVAAHAVGCAWRFPSDGPFGVRPCLEFDAGRTSGEGVGVSRAEKHSSPWLSTGAQLRAEVLLWRVALGLSAAAIVPLWRAHFYLEPDLEGFTTPTVGFRAESFASLLF
jgi:hypothetical protein